MEFSIPEIDRNGKNKVTFKEFWAGEYEYMKKLWLKLRWNFKFNLCDICYKNWIKLKRKTGRGMEKEKLQDCDVAAIAIWNIILSISLYDTHSMHSVLGFRSIHSMHSIHSIL